MAIMAVSLKLGGAFQHYAVQIEQQKQQLQTLEAALDASNREGARLQIECGPAARQSLLEEARKRSGLCRNHCLSRDDL